GLPASRVITAAIVSFSSQTSCVKRRTIFMRSEIDVLAHRVCAARALATAAEISSAPKQGTVPTVSPVAGLRTVIRSPVGTTGVWMAFMIAFSKWPLLAFYQGTGVGGCEKTR